VHGLHLFFTTPFYSLPRQRYPRHLLTRSGKTQVSVRHSFSNCYPSVCTCCSPVGLIVPLPVSMDRDGNTTPGGLKSPSFSPFSPGARRRTSGRSSLPPQVTPPVGLRWRQSSSVLATDRDQASPFLDPTPEMLEEQRKLVERHFIDERNSPSLDHATAEAGESSFSQSLARRKQRSAPKLTDFFNESETRRRVDEDPFADDGLAGRGMHSPLSNFSLRRIPSSQPLIDHTIPSHQPEHTVVAHRSEFARTGSSSSIQMSSLELSQKFSQSSDIAPSQEAGEPGSKWKGYYDYKNLRQRIKDYENSFQATQGRKPKIDDINGDSSLGKQVGFRDLIPFGIPTCGCAF